ncbi:MAG: MoaD/ThiS family protein [Actinomycetota bacterium]|nr:MoaD/ThiS family protein [Actinomycetota bacterium]
MRFQVKVVGILSRKAKGNLEGGWFDYHSNKPLTPSNLIKELGIPESMVGSTLVNGKRADKEQALADGDRIAILPRVSGG